MVEEVAPPAALLERCHRGYVDGWWEGTKYLPGARIERWAEATAMGSSIPSELANTVFVTEPPDDPEGLMERVRGFFAGQWQPWRIVASGPAAKALETVVGTTTMVRKPGDPGMLLTVSSPRAAPDSLRLERVSTPEQLSDFTKAVSSAFRIPGFVLKTMYPRPPAEGEAVVLLVGYERGEPAACAATVFANGIAEIFTVGVRPSSRRRGFGEAITWAAVEAGRERGCDGSYLQASQMGLPLYQHMGFQAVTQYAEWHAKISALNRARALFYFTRLALGGG